MKRAVIFTALFVALVLVACSAEPEISEVEVTREVEVPVEVPVEVTRLIEVPVEVTRLVIVTPEPTSTAKAVPLTEADVESLMATNGDFPNNVSPGQVSNIPPADYGFSSYYDEAAVRVVTLELYNSRYDAYGYVSILLYESLGDVGPQYERFVDSLPERHYDRGETIEVGDLGYAAKKSQGGFLYGTEPYSYEYVVFARCHAVVVVVLPVLYATGQAAAYAGRLDERLATFVCY